MKLKKVKFKIVNKLSTRLIIFTILSILFMAIMHINGNPIIKYINDGNFQFSRILSLESIFTTPVNFKLFNHLGQMPNLFYPWLFVYPMYILIVIFQNLIVGYYVYFILLTIITLEICYRCALKINQKVSYSLAFSILYTFSTYRMLNIYYRLAVGEAVAMTVWPIVLLGIYKLFYTKEANYKYLIVGLTCLVYSHPLSIILVIVMLLYVIISNLIRQNLNKLKLINFLKAVGISALLSVGYFGPMFQMLFSEKIKLPMTFNLNEEAFSTKEFFVNSLNNSFTGAEPTIGIGIILIIFLIFAIISFKKFNNFEKDIFFIGVACIILATTIFPWQLFQDTVHLLQFPWRFLALSTLCISYVGAISLYNAINVKWKVVLASLACVLLLGQYASLEALSRSEDLNKYTTNENLLELYNNYYEFGDTDYAPERAVSNWDTFTSHKVKINDDENEMKPTYTAKSIEYDIDGTKNNNKVLIPVLQYPGETVYVNNEKVLDAKTSNDGRLQINVGQGNKHIVVSYHYTILAKLSYLVSIVTLGVLVYFNIKQRKVKGDNNE